MSTVQLHQAVNALYYNSDAGIREQANQWLEQWQLSIEAWQVSVDVLQTAGAPLEAYFYCAQTLRRKVRESSASVSGGNPICAHICVAVCLQYADTTGSFKGFCAIVAGPTRL
jgi:hypothetical protein